MGTRPPPSRTSILLLPSSRCPPVARLPNRGWSYDRYRTGNPHPLVPWRRRLCGGTQQMRPPSRRTAPPCTASSPSARRSTSIPLRVLAPEHFSDTCVLAESAGGRIDGFISAYAARPARRPVRLARGARGHRLGRAMLRALLRRKGLEHVRHLETTVGPDNQASRRSFAGLAAELGAHQRTAVLRPATVRRRGP